MDNFNVDRVRFFCHAILPLVYDDSLSYYEAICRFTKKLNEVIDETNSIPEYINQLVSEERLKDIVSNIFDDLKAQIAKANEHDSKTATADRYKNDLVWLGNELYIITRNMLAGDQYFVGSNCRKIDIEELISNIYNSESETMRMHGLEM